MYYSHQPNFSYQNYLQAKSFEKSIRLKIDEQTKLLIGTGKRIQEEFVKSGIQIIEKIELVGDEICYRLNDIHNSIDDLNATFNWGFSEILISLNAINESLESLIEIAKTPIQTWAYENFEIARESYRKELYEEALEYLDRAINGYGSNIGYKTEYRFHFLKGIIFLGSFRNNSPEIINLKLAEESFLFSYRYSKVDDPDIASKSMMNAGWASYCQGEMIRALEYTKQSIQINPNNAEAFFQLAKIELHQNNIKSGIRNLKTAIDLDKLFAIKARNDQDINKYEKSVYNLFKELIKEKEQVYKALYIQLKPRISQLISLYKDKPIQNNDNQVIKLFESGVRDADENNLLAYISAIQSLKIASNQIDNAIKLREQEIEKYIRQINYSNKLENAKISGGIVGSILGFALGAVIGGVGLGVVSFILAIPVALYSIFDSNAEKTADNILLYGAIIGGICGGLYGLVAGAKTISDYFKGKIKY